MEPASSTWESSCGVESSLVCMKQADVDLPTIPEANALNTQPYYAAVTFSRYVSSRCTKRTFLRRDVMRCHGFFGAS